MTVPNAWKTIRLEELVDAAWGDTSVTKKSYVEKGYTAFSATGADGFLPYFDYEKSGIVLSAIGANCGKIWLAEGRWSCIKNTMRFFVKDESTLSTKFLFHFLSDPSAFIRRGSGQPFIRQEDVRHMVITYPSIAEQERIVEILEDHLSRLDAALADVKQAKLKAAQFRVSFMRDVFRGTQDWEHLKLRELGKWQGGGTPSKSNPAYWTNGTIPWISPKDMGLDEISSTQDLISEDAVSNSSVNKIDANSVVVVVRSGILERVLPISIINMTATLNQDMKALTLNDRVLPKFAFYLLQAFQQDILQKCRKTGTTVASINTEALMNYEVKVPTIREQESLLAYLESQISRIQGSTKLIDVAEKTGSSLRRSLLQAAFTGQLTKKEVNV